VVQAWQVTPVDQVLPVQAKADEADAITFYIGRDILRRLLVGFLRVATGSSRVNKEKAK
jgi:hypothetical protein